jgi:uncharacterized membrane protein
MLYDDTSYIPSGGIGVDMMLVLLILVGVFIYFMVKSDKSGFKPQEPSALDVVNRRYAKGEIDRETYLELRKDLGY